MRHKHADVIHAWAEGAGVQVRGAGGTKWSDIDTPGFITTCEYRIKPKTKTVRYRNYILEDGRVCVIDTTNTIVALGYGSRWLGEEQTVEVTVKADKAPPSSCNCSDMCRGKCGVA